MQRRRKRIRKNLHIIFCKVTELKAVVQKSSLRFVYDSNECVNKIIRTQKGYSLWKNTLQICKNRGTWVAPSVKPPPLDFSSGHDLRVGRWSGALGSRLGIGSPLWFPLSLPSFCPSLACAPAHALSLSTKTKSKTKQKKKKTTKNKPNKNVQNLYTKKVENITERNLRNFINGKER